MAFSKMYLYLSQIWSKPLGVLGRIVYNSIISNYSLLMLPKKVVCVELWPKSLDQITKKRQNFCPPTVHRILWQAMPLLLIKGQICYVGLC